MNKRQKRGFTLVELLIVIAILAILATVALLVLNPVQLLKQARDSQRISDIGTLNSALSFYLSTASTSSIDLDGATSACSSLCYVNVSGTSSNCGGRHAGKTTTADTDRTVDSTGWIPVNLNNSTGGSPLSRLPVDPVNDTTYFYSYVCDNTNYTYELDSDMESTRYANAGDNDVESKDGGSSNNYYEVGSDPGLDL